MRRTDQIMTLDDFELWLAEHPTKWKQYPRKNRTTHTELPVQPPQIYLQFLDRFGPMRIFVNEVFLDFDDIADEVTTLREYSGSQEQGLRNYTPFFNLGYDSIVLCFHNDIVIDFDPLNGETFVAHSFLEFLERYIETEGAQFWL